MPTEPGLLRIGYYKAPPVSEVMPRVIPPGREEVELVTEGVVYFREGERELTLGCGALFWHRAGEQTISRTEATSPYECISVFLPATPGRKRPVPRLSIMPDHQKVRELVRELMQAYHDDAVERKILANYARSRLLWEAHLGRVRRSSSVQPAAVSAALDLIEKAYARPGTGVREMAEHADISESHLHALCRKHLHETPHALLMARRLREAKLLLSGSSQTIKSIAADCGFVNIETFYRAFKRQVGTTPHLFRLHSSLPLLGKM